MPMRAKALLNSGFPWPPDANFAERYLGHSCPCDTMRSIFTRRAFEILPGSPLTDPVLLDFREAATRLHVSEHTVRRYGKSGLLDERRVGPWLVRYTAESVDKLIRAGKDHAA